jgi:hypothetical protein
MRIFIIDNVLGSKYGCVNFFFFVLIGSYAVLAKVTSFLGANKLFNLGGKWFILAAINKKRLRCVSQHTISKQQCGLFNKLHNLTPISIAFAQLIVAGLQIVILRGRLSV